MKRSIGGHSKRADTYPNKVRRALKSHGIKIRDKGAAQSAALKSGRSSHPTKNKGHSEGRQDKKISESVAESWEKLSEEELESRRETSRKQWANMSEEEKVKAKGVCYTGDKKGGYRGF